MGRGSLKPGPLPHSNSQERDPLLGKEKGGPGPVSRATPFSQPPLNLCYKLVFCPQTHRLGSTSPVPHTPPSSTHPRKAALEISANLSLVPKQGPLRMSCHLQLTLLFPYCEMPLGVHKRA